MTASLDVSASDVVSTFTESVRKRKTLSEPYRHFVIESVFPKSIARELTDLPFAAPTMGGVSGRRELHNDTRSYFDVANMARFPTMRVVAEALQSREAVRAIHDSFAAPIDDTFLRLEYALDSNEFWLEPHTDLGVKKFTCLIYLSDEPEHADLGTDIYWSKERHWGRHPFTHNTAVIFVPGNDTWHGFEPRKIAGVRKSIVFNYVTHDWRAREQLSFPDSPVRI